MSNEQAQKDAQELALVRSVALYSSLVGVVFAFLFLGLIFNVSLGMMLASMGLVSVGAVVVGVLITLSFAEEAEDEH